jgi:3',5'-cyclic AMP phosphodiesterase CpdA
MTDPDQPIDSFLHITDLHFWELVTNPFRLMNKRFVGNLNVYLKRRHEFAMENAEPYSDYAASLGIANVLVTGDFASTATPLEFQRGKEWLQGLEKRGLAPTVIPGNHDVYTFESVRRKRFESYYEPWLVDGRLPGTTTLTGGTRIHWISTVCPNWFTNRGNVRDEDIQRLIDGIPSTSETAVVVGHYPILNETPGYTVNFNRGLKNAERLRRALGQSGKKILYVHGHVHRFNYSRDPEFSDLTHLSTGAFFRIAQESQSLGEFTEVRVLPEHPAIIRHRLQSNEWCAEEIPLGQKK